MSENRNNQNEQPTEEAPGQPDGKQPATIPGAENPESEKIKQEINPNTE